MRRAGPALDLARLPSSGFGAHGLWWWAGLAFMLMETAGFGLAGAAYLFLIDANPHWPISARPPDLLWGTAQTLLLALSLPPALALSKAARRRDLSAVRRLGAAVAALNALSVVVRAFEFTRLNTRWDQDAYGSITWTLILLHTVHLLTDFVDTLFLTVVLFTHPVATDRFADVDDDALYWAFVVITWAPLYLLIYWAPRWTS